MSNTFERRFKELAGIDWISDGVLNIEGEKLTTVNPG